MSRARQCVKVWQSQWSDGVKYQSGKLNLIAVVNTLANGDNTRRDEHE